ncbi:MAG: protein TolA, partial [Hyphomicrobium sp.]|nr:protein TolA [Hyphomicrobium sp.]
SKFTGKTAGTADGRDTVLSGPEINLLKGLIQGQLARCSRLPGGGGGADTPVVTVKWRLKPDGSLDGEPVIVGVQNTPLFKIASEASVRAVKDCSPFSLPADKYASWSSVEWDFDWPKILGLR